MKIDEWKKRLIEFHKEMKEDLGAERLEMHVADKVMVRTECWPALSAGYTDVEIVAR